MNIVPIGDRVLIKREVAEATTSGGIVLPDSAKEKPQVGKVLAVGTGKQLQDGSLRPLDLKIGDSVYFSSWAGDEYKSNGEEVLLMREEDVLAVIE